MWSSFPECEDLEKICANDADCLDCDTETLICVPHPTLTGESSCKIHNTGDPGVIMGHGDTN